ncbi:hypothetical protein TNCV_3056571 [Trichonephila clavipes]|nr:hypothetical protein TNCV_3056571 [Trichonephila clavipes]
MLYHRTILEPHTAYPIPAGTHYIVLTVQKTAFATSTYPDSCTGRKATFGGKGSTQETSASRHETWSRRSERPMTPVTIPDVLEPVPIPDVPPVHIPQTPVQIPDVLPPVQIPDVLEPVQIPDVLDLCRFQNHLCRFQMS